MRGFHDFQVETVFSCHIIKMELPICFFPDVPIHASVLFSGLEISVQYWNALPTVITDFFFPSVMIGMHVVFVGLGHSGICVLFNVFCLTHL
jgi:hypothetical protein